MLFSCISCTEVVVCKILIRYHRTTLHLECNRMRSMEAEKYGKNFVLATICVKRAARADKLDASEQTGLLSSNFAQVERTRGCYQVRRKFVVSSPMQHDVNRLCRFLCVAVVGKMYSLLYEIGRFFKNCFACSLR